MLLFQDFGFGGLPIVAKILRVIRNISGLNNQGMHQCQESRSDWFVVIATVMCHWAQEYGKIATSAAAAKTSASMLVLLCSCCSSWQPYC